VTAAGTGFATAADVAGQPVAAAAAPVAGVGWTILVEQPLSEAFAPIYAALWRTASLLVIAVALAALLAFGLARRLTVPIHLLEQGTHRIGAGEFEHRIEIKTGDELQRLADSFNIMAAELTISQERQERIAKLKRFLAPQVAELVDRTGEDTLLQGRRTEVVALFGDLRGFTPFSARVRPEDVMSVLSEYHEALGGVINRHEATLISFSGDGLMVLVNAPVPVSAPALRAVDLAVDMQTVVQDLIGTWRAKGYRIGFGVGLASGPATVGRIGYEGRFDYTAIGSVVNLAARLCASAADGGILLDVATAQAIGGERALVSLGAMPIKGYEENVAVFTVEHDGQVRSA
jgi:adenylate cyclase